MGRISYTGSVAGVDAKDLRGFFDAWPDTPSPETCLQMLGGSDHVVVALEEQGRTVVGFIAALSDGVLCAFVSSLRVLPAYGGRAIGSELVRRMLEKLDDHYVVSLTCDPNLQPFYERFGMRPSAGMLLLNRDRSAGPDVLPPRASNDSGWRRSREHRRSTFVRDRVYNVGASREEPVCPKTGTTRTLRTPRRRYWPICSPTRA